MPSANTIRSGWWNHVNTPIAVDFPAAVVARTRAVLDQLGSNVLLADFFVDVPYQGEIVRARRAAGALRLHEGGEVFIDLPLTGFTKEQISPTRDTRLRWMQSVVHCTHYVAGPGEQAYLHPEEAPDITFIPRDPIDRSDEAYTDLPA